jgi:hypothetical protein
MTEQESESTVTFAAAYLGYMKALCQMSIGFQDNLQDFRSLRQR